MSAWTSAELKQIENAEELQIASLRRDGTLRKPVTIWVVRVGDDLFVRSVNGRDSAWYRGTQVRHKGHIRAGGVNQDVSFVEETDSGINERIDTAYRTKYSRYAGNVLNSVLTPEARARSLRSLVAVIDCGNESSLRLFRRFGYQEAGRLND